MNFLPQPSNSELSPSSGEWKMKPQECVAKPRLHALERVGGHSGTVKLNGFQTIAVPKGRRWSLGGEKRCGWGWFFWD
jgi:hypothetical protein